MRKFIQKIIQYTIFFQLIGFINQNIDSLIQQLEHQFEEKIYRRFLLFVLLGILVLNRRRSGMLLSSEFCYLDYSQVAISIIYGFWAFLMQNLPVPT